MNEMTIDFLNHFDSMFFGWELEVQPSSKNKSSLKNVQKLSVKLQTSLLINKTIKSYQYMREDEKPIKIIVKLKYIYTRQYNKCTSKIKYQFAFIK